MGMRQIQKAMVCVGLALGLALVLFPPWVRVDSKDEIAPFYRLGHGALMGDPFPRLKGQRVLVDYNRMACEAGGLVLLVALGCMIVAPVKRVAFKEPDPFQVSAEAMRASDTKEPIRGMPGRVRHLSRMPGE